MTNRRKQTRRSNGPASLKSFSAPPSPFKRQSDEEEQVATPPCTSLPEESGEHTPLLDLDEHGRAVVVPEFETDVLTSAMLMAVIAEEVDGHFARTPAGYVRLCTRLRENGDVVLEATHWRNYKQADQDRRVTTTLQAGPMSFADIVADE
jgi:hypothetical protein